MIISPPFCDIWGSSAKIKQNGENLFRKMHSACQKTILFPIFVAAKFLPTVKVDFTFDIAYSWWDSGADCEFTRVSKNCFIFFGARMDQKMFSSEKENPSNRYARCSLSPYYTIASYSNTMYDYTFRLCISTEFCSFIRRLCVFHTFDIGCIVSSVASKTHRTHSRGTM